MPQKRRDLEHMRRTMNYVKNKPDGASFGINLGSIGQGISNFVGNAVDTVSNAFSGGGGSQPEAPAPPTPPTPETPNEESSNDNGPGFLGMLRAIREKVAAMKAAKAAAMAKMGGPGENVVIRGKMTKGGGMSGLGFRPHFKGGFGADVQQGASMAGKKRGAKKR